MCFYGLSRSIFFGHFAFKNFLLNFLIKIDFWSNFRDFKVSNIVLDSIIKLKKMTSVKNFFRIEIEILRLGPSESAL
jgi:hypothetical protein